MRLDSAGRKFKESQTHSIKNPRTRRSDKILAFEISVLPIDYFS